MGLSLHCSHVWSVQMHRSNHRRSPSETAVHCCRPACMMRSSWRLHSKSALLILCFVHCTCTMLTRLHAMPALKLPCNGEAAPGGIGPRQTEASPLPSHALVVDVATPLLECTPRNILNHPCKPPACRCGPKMNRKSRCSFAIPCF